MKAAHGKDFANAPDLLEFQAGRSDKNERGGYDIYGCGKAQRENMLFQGIAVVHAVFEHDDWFFTGWTFTIFPNELCKALADPAWRPITRLIWSQPMEELRGLPADIKPRK